MARTKMGRVARDGAGLTQIQRRFLRKMVREPKALSELLREQQVCRATFAGWREEAAFERAFRVAAAGLTKDTLTDLRMSFAMCGRIISEELLRVQTGDEAPPAPPAQPVKAATPAVADVGGQTGQVEAASESKPSEEKKGKRRDPLTAEEQRLCFEVIKVGMGAFVPKVLPRRRKRVFRRVDPVAFAELKNAQGGGGGEVRRVGVE